MNRRTQAGLLLQVCRFKKTLVEVCWSLSTLLTLPVISPMMKTRRLSAAASWAQVARVGSTWAQAASCSCTWARLGQEAARCTATPAQAAVTTRTTSTHSRVSVLTLDTLGAAMSGIIIET